jgi:hypothetical protein
MLELGRLISIVAVGHEERIARSSKRLLQRLHVFYIRVNQITTNLREVLSGGFGRITRDGTDAVGFGGFLEGFDDGAALGAGRTDDGEQRGRGVLGDRHGKTVARSRVESSMRELRDEMNLRDRSMSAYILPQLYRGLVINPRSPVSYIIHPMTTVIPKAADD